MDRRRIITIGREYGSGGRQIGEMVAEKLGLAFYDRSIIRLSARETGFTPEYIEEVEESITSSFLFNLAVGEGRSTTVNLPNETRLFIEQSRVIREIADKEACVIVGRCADYVLKDRTDCFHIFIYSDIQHKLERAVRSYGLAPAEAPEALRKKDKQRARYYNRYTDRTWGDPHNFHLSLHSDYIGIDRTVELICELARNE